MDAKTGADNLGRIVADIPVSERIPEFDVAIEAAVRAGGVIMRIYQGAFEVSTKTDDSPVTEADLASNEVIKEILLPAGHAILSEEDADDSQRLSEDTVWIVDPLDGTSDFVDRTGEFTVMVALVKNGVPILGVIGWPAEQTLFVAQKGLGAYKYSKGTWNRMSVTAVSEISECRAVGSRHHLSLEEKAFVKSLGIDNFTSIGSSLKVAKIASGMAEIYITTTNKMKEWDTAASHCIISEAGGRMTDVSGNGITYNNTDVRHQNGILVTNGLVHERVVKDFKAGLVP